MVTQSQAHQLPGSGGVNSSRSAPERPISLSSSLALVGERQRILTSTALERLLASRRHHPMSFSWKPSLRAKLTRVGAVPTALSRLREWVTVWRCSGLAAFKGVPSSPTVGRRKIAKKIAKNSRCYANTLRPWTTLRLVRGPFLDAGASRRISLAESGEICSVE